VVLPGDTLFSLALTYDTDVETLRQLNNLPDDTIAVGQTLLIPGTGEQEQPGQQPGATSEPDQQVVYTVQQGDTLSSIAAELGVDWQQIAAFNGIEAPNYTIYRGQRLVIPGVTPTPVPTAEVTIHVVQQGDTLYGIAIQYGVTLQALLAANGITNPDQLSIGQELVIPE
jgi:LysM repeat protein